MLRAVLLAALCASAAAVWPLPQSLRQSGALLSLSPSKLAITATGQTSDVLTQAVQRYAAIIAATPVNTSAASLPAGTAALTGLDVDVLDSSLSLNLTTDESYNLTITAPTATLTATTAYGALRGLETFSQLVQRTSAGYAVAEAEVVDAPRFHHRGILLDTARHYLPVTTILQFIDAMAYSKVNVLHWHIVDDQAFPYVSDRFPSLSAKGAYDNQTHIYTPTDVANIVLYARLRGVRVVPEFDTPGHTTSWGKGTPGLLTPCYSGSSPDGSFGPIDPSNPNSFTFLSAFFSEVASVFPDQYVHIGGDEVGFDCWLSNPNIQSWMKKQGITSGEGVEQFYETALLKLVGETGKSYVVWEEIFDNGLKVLPDTVVEVWKGGWQDTMAKVTAAGLRGILSSPWYLNYISYGSDWRTYYQVEPLNFTGTAQQKELVMGGEACFWAEYIDDTNVISRAWPRASAVAERLWSAQDVRDPDAASPRLHQFRCLLLSRGINAEPADGPSFCPFEFPAQYSPPWQHSA